MGDSRVAHITLFCLLERIFMKIGYVVPDLFMLS